MGSILHYRNYCQQNFNVAVHFDDRVIKHLTDKYSCIFSIIVIMSSILSINSFETLKLDLDNLFKTKSSYDIVQKEITQLLNNVDFSGTEISKYTYFDSEKSYTRNLAASDGKHYTLLVLCWSPGKESKIHNHPCDGCFIKTLSGCIKETRYTTDTCNDEIKQSAVKFYREGQVSYMCDDMGLHKVGNACTHVGAVTLHLYTPPFQECKVWSSAGVGKLSSAELGAVGFFSIYGLRTPNLEGKPGKHAKMQQELLATVKMYDK